MKNIFRILKNKFGNSFLFMPYMCIFGCMFIYIFMDMGTAYARSIEIQTMTDAGCRAGVFAGMNGKYTQYIVDRSTSEPHIYVMLDGGTALGVSRAVILLNIDRLSIETGDIANTTPGKFNISNGGIRLSNPRLFDSHSDIHGVSTIPVWNGSDKYVPVNISSFYDYQEVMKTGNFFVYVEGKYKTLMASVLGRESLRLSGFADAVASAEYIGP